MSPLPPVRHALKGLEDSNAVGGINLRSALHKTLAAISPLFPMTIARCRHIIVLREPGPSLAPAWARWRSVSVEKSRCARSLRLPVRLSYKRAQQIAELISSHSWNELTNEKRRSVGQKTNLKNDDSTDTRSMNQHLAIIIVNGSKITLSWADRSGASCSARGNRFGCSAEKNKSPQFRVGGG
jgi:hypothetical protein